MEPTNTYLRKILNITRVDKKLSIWANVTRSLHPPPLIMVLEQHCG